MRNSSQVRAPRTNKYESEKGALHSLHKRMHHHSYQTESTPGTSTGFTTSRPIYHLPQTAIQLIATHLLPDADDLTHFAQADPSFAEGVAHAYGYTFHVDRTSQHSILLKLLYPYIQNIRFVTDDRFGAATALAEGYKALSGPSLRSVKMVACKAGLDALSGNRQVRDLTMHVYKASAFEDVLTALRSLQQLDSLKLTCYRDKSLRQRDTPREQRCACQPFRLNDSAALIHACPTIKTFSLACECDANRQLMLPAFPRMRHLTVSGRLDAIQLGALNPYILSSLHSLTVENASDIGCVVTTLAPYVTGVHQAWTKKMSCEELETVLRHCPRLTSLNTVLSPPCEEVLTRYLPTLTQLRRLCVKVANSKDLGTRHMFYEGYYKPRLGALTQVVRATRNMEELHLVDLCIHPVEMDDMLAHIGGSVRSISIPLKSSDPNVDTVDILLLFLSCVLRHCTKLKTLMVSRPGSINLLARQRQRRGVPIIINQDATLRRVEALITQLERKMPGICMSSVKKLLDPKYGQTTKHDARKSMESSDSEIEN